MAEISKKFHLKIITPGRTAFEGDVDMVIMETIDGQMGVLAGHEPVATVLGLGPLKVFSDFDVEHFAVFCGFANINQTDVVILADVAEKADEIDLIRAKEAKERAEERIRDHSASIDMMRAEVALRRSLVRLELGNVHK